jgi:site-specific DNA recombinase
MKNPATRMRRSGSVRCAIYTRKSSEEGLEQEFNSLQAQREACEAQPTAGRLGLPARGL